MFGFTVIAVLSALLFGNTECAVSDWSIDGSSVSSLATDTAANCYSVAEDGTVSFAVTATGSGVVTITITTQPTGYVFALAANGDVTLTSGTLDHETTASMDLIFTGSDAGDASTGALTCTITVTDVNEFDPVIQMNTPLCYSFIGPLAASTDLINIIATDADTSQTLTLAITGGNSNSAYAISVGAIAVGGTDLTTSSTVITISVTDDVAPMKSATATFTILIDSLCPNVASLITISAAIFMAMLLAFLG